jgi:hypothetical protein
MALQWEYYVLGRGYAYGPSGAEGAFSEYISEPAKGDYNLDETMFRLANQLGADGWELVAMSGANSQNLWFKRPKSP